MPDFPSSFIHSTLTVNSLCWFTSLEPNEQGVTRRIQEDLMPYLDSIGFHHETFQPQTAGQLFEMLNHVAGKACVGLRPVLHFDTHGDDIHGIKIAASGEFVSWPDLVAGLRAVNIATGNNLCVISGACYSMNAAWKVTLSEPCPFYMLIAPREQVSSGFLEDNIFAFYRSAFDGLEIYAAYEQHLARHLLLHHCERMLAYQLAHYVRDYCIGKRGNERREELMTKVIEAGLAPNRHELRKKRKQAKAWTRPSQAMIERFAKGHASTFLMGRSLGFDIADVMTLVKSENKKEAVSQATAQRLRKRA